MKILFKVVDSLFCKEVLAFSLVPFWGGLFFGMLLVFNHLETTIYVEKHGLWVLGFYLIMLLAPAIISMLLGGWAAFALGWVYTVLGLKKRWLNYLFVFSCGGTTAFFLAAFFSGTEYLDFSSYVEFAPDFMKNSLASKAFVLGSIGSWITAVIVLPPKKQ